MIWRPTVFMREVTSGAVNPAGLSGVSVQPAAAEKGLTEPQKRTQHSISVRAVSFLSWEGNQEVWFPKGRVAVTSGTEVAHCPLPVQTQGGRHKARVPRAKPGESTRDYHSHLDKSVTYS